MNKLLIQGIVLVLMLLALPLASFGTTTDALWASILALVVFGLASLTPPVLRFVGDNDNGNGDEKSQDKSKKEDEQ